MLRALRMVGYFLLGLILIVAVASVLMNVIRTPSHTRNWKVQFLELPTAQRLDEDQVAIENVRDFVYGPDGEIKDARYRDETYRLSELDSLWYGISHFGRFGLAHTFLSFGFTDGRYLTFSFEARQEVGQNYNPVLGVFGAYEMILVVSEERDVIGLRTHVRGERVFLYEIELPHDKIVNLFLEMIHRVDEIYDSPEFYHTITDNCTTSILRYAQRLSTWQRYFSYKILLPGYSDQLAYDAGFLDRNRPFPEIRQEAFLDPARTELEDPDFSRKIRGL